MGHRSAIAILVALTVSACAASPPAPTVIPASIPTAAAAPAPTLSPSPSPAPVLRRDLTERPQIWFSPLDPSPPDESRPFSGGPDFMALFDEDAPWAEAAAAVHVFKLYGGWVAGRATDDELRRVVHDLNRRGIAIGFEASPLRYGSDCGAWIEEGATIMRRLEDAGAEIRFVALDHPYDSGVLAEGPGSCGLSIEEAASGVADYVAAIRRVLPGVVVGTIETAANERAEVERWVEAYRSAAGEDFDFVHLDLNFARPDWPEATLEIERYLHDRGIEFGMIYFGNWEDRSDAVWLGRVEDRFTTYELLGGRPDHAIFQSWHPYPQRILPETDPSAFTAIIHRYLRPRTELTLEVTSALTAAGTLTMSDGTPVSGAQVDVATVASDSSGVWHEYSVAGVVPDGAVVADLGYRVNTECACSGEADFTLGAVRYSEDGVDRPLTDAMLPPGSYEWSVWGIAVQGADQAGLHVTADAGQDAAANSPRFSVTPGANYTATFVARVAPVSLGSGYFAIFVSDGRTELTREMVPLSAAVVPIGSAVTDAAGRYELAIDAGTSVTGTVRASYGGGTEAWPARADVRQ